MPRRKEVFLSCSLPGTPLLSCATEAHLRSSVTGLLSVVLPDWIADCPKYLVNLKPRW